jgi:hypothetical protein
VVRRQAQAIKLTVRRCLWSGVLDAQPVQPVQVVRRRPPRWPDGYQLAVITTDLDPGQVASR